MVIIVIVILISIIISVIDIDIGISISSYGHLSIRIQQYPTSRIQCSTFHTTIINFVSQGIGMEDIQVPLE